MFDIYRGRRVVKKNRRTLGLWRSCHDNWHRKARKRKVDEIRDDDIGVVDLEVGFRKNMV